jgi:putative mycofactocin binding protein MftB
MSLYETLVRRAWSSGEYRSGNAPCFDALREDGENLRCFIRSKIEWILERDGREAGQGISRGRADRLSLARHVRFREERRGGLLYETRSEKLFRLSPTGAAVLRELVDGAGVEEAVGRLRSRFRDPDGAIEREARAFIESLRSRGFLEMLDG